MDEAAEIAKLRLFLKLVAQIDDVNHVEPLPDLDFNIKTGNLLVGIADEGDADTRLGGGQLDLGSKIAEITAVVERVADAYEEFNTDQSRDTGKSDHTSVKQTLTTHLEAARDSADKLLHKKREERITFDSWRKSHRPFHWFVEFPSVWRNGGFDVIIGNPPYINTKKVIDYQWIGYQTQKCPDLYAVCTERGSSLLNSDGRIAMIVMHSLCFSKNFVKLREHLTHRFPSLWVSSYDNRPDSLFAGSAQVRNSIIIAGAKATPSGLYTSSCRRWLTECSPVLFASVEYVKPPSSLQQLNGKTVWPFVDCRLVSEAFGKLVSNNRPISSVIVSNRGYSLAYKKVARYMLGISEKPPPTQGRATTHRYGYLHFLNLKHRDMSLLALVGRWGYLWWMIFSDEFNVTKGPLCAFPGDIERLSGYPMNNYEEISTEHHRLWKLAKELKEEMPKHLKWQTNAGVRVGRYNMIKCRHITDEADLLLAHLWGIEDAYEAAGNLRDRMVFGNKD